MTRTRRAVVLAAAVAGTGLLVTACGSSGSSNLVAVPVVQGQGLDQAAVALCKAGLRVRDSIYMPGLRVSGPTVPPKYIADPAMRGGVHPVTVIGTNPAGGVRVTPGSTVSITLTGNRPTLVLVPKRQCVATKPPSGRT
jgi:beta-lactam-binding protein with PASTA domain